MYQLKNTGNGTGRHIIWRQKNRRRQPWIKDVKLAISWCPGETDILDALAKKVSTEKSFAAFF